MKNDYTHYEVSLLDGETGETIMSKIIKRELFENVKSLQIQITYKNIIVSDNMRNFSLENDNDG